MDLKNFFVSTVILEFVKEFNVNNTDYEVMNIWKYIHKSSNRGFLFATAEVVYIIATIFLHVTPIPIHAFHELE